MVHPGAAGSQLPPTFATVKLANMAYVEGGFGLGPYSCPGASAIKTGMPSTIG
jgi:hypothetical protein